MNKKNIFIFTGIVIGVILLIGLMSWLDSYAKNIPYLISLNDTLIRIGIGLYKIISLPTLLICSLLVFIFIQTKPKLLNLIDRINEVEAAGIKVKVFNPLSIINKEVKPLGEDLKLQEVQKKIISGIIRTSLELLIKFEKHPFSYKEAGTIFGEAAIEFSTTMPKTKLELYQEGFSASLVLSLFSYRGILLDFKNSVENQTLSYKFLPGVRELMNEEIISSIKKPESER
jgi:hypothetical protein